MRRFLMITAAVVLALVATPATQAAGHVGHGPVGHARVVSTRVGVGVGGHSRNYLALHGVRFNGGYFYRGINHRQWTRWYWNPRYGTYFYFDPFAQGYYYWNATAGVYYPVSYITVAPPTVVVTPPVALSGSVDDGMTPPLPIQ